MSADQAEILSGIRQKIHAVRSRLQESDRQNAELQVKNEELQQLVQQKQSQIEALEEKNQKLTLAKSILGESGDTADARIRINRIVREIDKCIALLNR